MSRVTKIKRILTNYGWSQSDLARKCNMQPASVSRFAGGNGKAGPGVMSRIASALSVDPDEIFDANGWPLTVQPEAAFCG